MSLDITVKTIKNFPCPHCGKSIPGFDIQNEYQTGGCVYYELLKKIGYDDGKYGKYVTLTEEQAKIACKEFNKNGDTFVGEGIANAIVNEWSIVFEADW